MNRRTSPIAAAGATTDCRPLATGHRALIPDRQAFTLIEMLVVITIIGILASLATVAAYKALEAAKRGRVLAEIANIDGALKEYKNKYGEYPPSDFGPYYVDSSTVYTLADVGHPVRKHFAKAFPRINEPSSTWSTLDGLDPAQALTLLLLGFSKDPALPLSGVGGPLIAAGDHNSLFEFDRSRLKDTSGNAWPGFPITSTNKPPYYCPAGCTQPYVYFAAQSYLGHALSTSTPTLPIPYLSKDTPWGSGSPRALTVGPTANVVTGTGKSVIPASYSSFQAFCANPKTFQIISAGLDNDWGTPNISGATGCAPQNVSTKNGGKKIYYKSFNDGQGYSTTGGDDDNLTNISEKQLGDAKP